MNKSISILLALTSIVLLVSFGKTDAACGAPSPDTDPVGYCRQFYKAFGANPFADCSTGGDSVCRGGLVCIWSGSTHYNCECPIYTAIQSQIGVNGYNLTTGSYACTSSLLDRPHGCYFATGSPCGGSHFCVGSCNMANNVCQ